MVLARVSHAGSFPAVKLDVREKGIANIELREDNRTAASLRWRLLLVDRLEVSAVIVIIG